MTSNTYTSTTTLSHVNTERLQRGVARLTSGDYTVTRTTPEEISAVVATGDDKSYSVVLTETRSFCRGSDSIYANYVRIGLAPVMV